MTDDSPSSRRRPALEGCRLPLATLAGAAGLYSSFVAVARALGPSTLAALDDAAPSDADTVATRRERVARVGGDRR